MGLIHLGFEIRTIKGTEDWVFTVDRSSSSGQQQSSKLCF